MAHSHGAPVLPADVDGAPGGPPDRVVLGRGARVGLTVAILALVAATVAGLVLLRPTGEVVVSDAFGLGQEQVRGSVTDVERGPCPGLDAVPGPGPGSAVEGPAAEAGGIDGTSDAGGAAGPVEECATLTVVIDSGPDAGEIVVLTEAQGTSSLAVDDGDGIVLAGVEGEPLETRYRVIDLQRGPPLALLAAGFALAVVLVGRWRGLAALVGLGATFAILTLFVLPALLQGRDPLQVAVVGAAAIMVVSLYLAHGVSLRTTVALLGTLGSLALTGLLATVFLAAGNFSGLVSEEAIFLAAVSEQVDLRGLLLAGILIGALGVLDDVTVTQTSAVFELHAAAPGLGRRRLAASAMRIGRDHIASTVNTLVLAYAGAALPLLLLFVLAAQPVGDTLTNEVVAQEVVRTLVGGLGIVASVPLTTWLAVLVATRGSVEPVAAAGGGAAWFPYEEADDEAGGEHPADDEAGDEHPADGEAGDEHPVDGEHGAKGPAAVAGTGGNDAPTTPRADEGVGTATTGGDPEAVEAHDDRAKAGPRPEAGEAGGGEAGPRPRPGTADDGLPGVVQWLDPVAADADGAAEGAAPAGGGSPPGPVPAPGPTPMRGRRWSRRGRRAARAEQEAAELLAGLRAAEPGRHGTP